jgi:hypothetical protein
VGRSGELLNRRWRLSKSTSSVCVRRWPAAVGVVVGVLDGPAGRVRRGRAGEVAHEGRKGGDRRVRVLEWQCAGRCYGFQRLWGRCRRGRTAGGEERVASAPDLLCWFGEGLLPPPHGRYGRVLVEPGVAADARLSTTPPSGPTAPRGDAGHAARSTRRRSAPRTVRGATSGCARPGAGRVSGVPHRGSWPQAAREGSADGPWPHRFRGRHSG